VRSRRSGGTEPVAQLWIVAVRCAEQYGGDEVEPELPIARELQMEVGRRAVVLPVQRVEQALQVDLELLSLSAERRRVKIQNSTG
jgi:hypothetical protein